MAICSKSVDSFSRTLEGHRSRDSPFWSNHGACRFYSRFFGQWPRCGSRVGSHQGGVQNGLRDSISRQIMKIIRAKYLGMCFGVRDAISLALERAERGSLTILGELVHNDSVLDDLHRRGIRIEHD